MSEINDETDFQRALRIGSALPSTHDLERTISHLNDASYTMNGDAFVDKRKETLAEIKNLESVLRMRRCFNELMQLTKADVEKIGRAHHDMVAGQVRNMICKLSNTMARLMDYEDPQKKETA